MIGNGYIGRFEVDATVIGKARMWQGEADAFVDIGDIPLLFDGFTSDNVGSIVLGQPKDEQPPAPATPSACLTRSSSTRSPRNRRW